MNNYFQKDGKQSVTFVPSLVDLYQYMADNDDRLPNDTHSDIISDQRTQFTGTKTFQDALSLAEYGWDNRKKVSQIANQLEVTSNAQIKQSTTTMAVAGSYVDIGTYMSGDPNCMVEFEEQDSPKTIRVGFNISSSAETSKTAFHCRGAIVLALLAKLAESGYSTEIIVYESCASYEDHEHTDAFVLKASDSFMDEDSISFWCSHPSALRRLMFRMNECNDDATRVRWW